MGFTPGTYGQTKQDQDNPVVAAFTPDAGTSLMIAVACWRELSPYVNDVTWNSVSDTKIRSDERSTGQSNTYLGYLIDPEIASYGLFFNTAGSMDSRVAAMCYRGVHKTDPLEAHDGANGNASGNVISKTLTATLPSSMAVGAMASGATAHNAGGVFTKIWQGNGTSASTNSFHHGVDLPVGGNSCIINKSITGSYAGSVAMFNPGAIGNRIIFLGMKLGRELMDSLDRIYRGAFPDGWRLDDDLLRPDVRPGLLAPVKTTLWVDDPLLRRFQAWTGFRAAASRLSVPTSGLIPALRKGRI